MSSYLLNSDAAADNKSDMFGAIASGLCLIHCLITPIIFAVQVCSSSCCDAGPVWWSMIDYLFLVISIFAVYYSAKNTSITWMPYLLYISWAALALFILNERFEFFQINQAVNYIPAMSLVGLHLYNKKHCQCNTDSCCTTD